MKKVLKSKGLIISLIIAFFLVLIIFLNKIIDFDSRNYIKTDGIELYYRVFTEDGYSDWFKNGEESTNKKSILGIEMKVESKLKGHIIYNTFGDGDTFEDNDSYDSEMAGNKKHKIFGIKIDLTDNLYKTYNIYYRTYNKKDGWLDWTSSYNISGDNGVNIEKIQIKILKKNSDFKHKEERTSIGF